MLRLYRVVYKLCVLVFALFLILPLGACQSPTPQKANVTIRFAYPDPRQLYYNTDVSLPLTQRYEALATAFHEKNPYITVQLVPLTYEQYTGLSAADFDVLLFPSWYYADYTKRGILRSLVPWISLSAKEWSNDYLPTVLKPFERNGELWAIPWALDPLILYYNRDLFTQHEVATPQQDWTWSDFIEKANAVTDSEQGIFGSVLLYTYPLVTAVIYQHGGQVYDDWGQPTRTTFDDPLNAEALTWLQSLIYTYNVMPTPSQAIRAYGSGVFNLSRGIIEGKFATWAVMYSERGGMSWVSDFKWQISWGAAPLPRDVQAATTANAYVLGISSQAADADACWQWLAYLSQQLPSDLYLPARTSLLQKVQPEDSSNQEALSAGGAALEGILLINADMAENVAPAADAFLKAVDAILNKNEPVEEQLQQAQQKATP